MPHYPAATSNIMPSSVSSFPLSTLPQPGTITILKSPPGTGKSYDTREWIAQSFQQGTLKRVVWAVHSTLSEDSLASEAAKEFANLSVRTIIFKGQGSIPNRTEYSRQMQWSDSPEVKIVSFKQLPLIYDRHSQQQKIGAELLVIDELPLSGLTETLRLSTSELSQLASRSTILAQLLKVLGSVTQQSPGVISHYMDVRRYEEQHRFTGQSALNAIGNTWSDSDWEELHSVLQDDGISGERNQLYLNELLEAMRRDLAQPQHDSFRFGFSWKSSPHGGRYEEQFYGHILTPLRNLPPTVVLDAYAKQNIYDAIFPGSNPQIIEYGEHQPLQAELAEHLKMHPLSLRKQEAPQKYLQIAEEVLRLHQEHPVSLLLAKEQHQEGSHWKTALRDAAGRLGVTELPWEFHHHAGRGKNTHANRTIVSLMSPVLPRAHQMEDMAALYPDDPKAREAVHHDLIAAEWLQQLHRGRQPLNGTRIIVAFDPNLPESECIIKPYQPIHIYKKGSNNPRWRSALSAVSQELLALFGGVPRSSLAALGLIRIETTNPQTIKHHQRLLRQALANVAPPSGSLLAEWQANGTLGRYHDVPARSKKHAVEFNAVMNSLELNTLGVCHTSVAGQRLSSSIYGPPGASKDDIFRKIYR